MHYVVREKFFQNYLWNFNSSCLSIGENSKEVEILIRDNTRQC